jgi:hypothetical protein
MNYTLSDLRGAKIAAGDNDAAIAINKLFEDVKNHYLKLHRDWYINERFHRGDHWVVYNKTINRVQVIPITRGEIRRTVNKIRAQVRGIKNFVKRNQPRWEVQPDDTTDEAYTEAAAKNKLLQNIYETKQIKDRLTDVVVNGLKFSVGVMEGAVVEKEGEIDMSFWCDDTFDIYFDPSSPTIDGCRFIIKAVKKPLTSVLDNKNYKIKTGEITPDNKDGSSQYKELLEQEKYEAGNNNKGSKDMESVIVTEFWMKWMEAGKIKVRVLTVVGNQLVRVQNTSYRRYPFFIYNPEKDPNSIYSNAWIKDLISLNKSLDKSTSQIEGYIQRMLAGKYLIKQGVEVSTITDRGAEKIFYKGSTPPVQQNLQPLPSAPFSHLSNLERWIEELGGIREASLGRAPGSLQSGKAIEALQQADAATVAEPIENLERMLEEMAEFCLEIIADYQIASQEIIQDKEKIRYTGVQENVTPPEGVMVIKPGKVKVVIIPEIAYSEETKIERLFMLAQAGMIDPQTVLEKLSISNIGDILGRVKKMQEENMKEEMMKQREAHRSDGGGPEDTADLADQENTQLAAGQQVPLTPQALWAPEHLQLHVAFIQENKDVYNQQKEAFDNHIAAEEQYQQ